MSSNKSEIKRRDLAIDAAIFRLAVHRDSDLTVKSIQDKSEMIIWNGGYMVLLDGEPLLQVTLKSDTEFTMLIP